MRSWATAAATLWSGAALVVSVLRPLHRPTLAHRLGPYFGRGDDPVLMSRAQLAGALLVAGDHFDRLLKVTEPLADRLARAQRRLDPASFRFQQVSHAVMGLALAGVVVAVIDLPPALAALVVLVTPLAVVAAHEHHLGRAAAARTDQVVRELPTIVEQLAMLVSAGHSVPSALAHLGTRGHGAGAEDLRRITRQLQQGVDEPAALRAWADLRRAAAVTHLVGVLALASEATDLDRLLEQEAESIRAQAHRDLLADLERRGQQVWIPVTVATLLPGSLLLLVPFLDALRLFAGA